MPATPTDRSTARHAAAARSLASHAEVTGTEPVFGDRDSGVHLLKFSWTEIVRHIAVKGRASPDDPALTEYWVQRRRRVKPPLDPYNLRLLDRQAGRCPLCGEHLLTAEQPPQSPREWERWWLHVTRRAINQDYLVYHGRADATDGPRTRLLHASCHRGLRTRQRNGTPAQHARALPRLA